MRTVLTPTKLPEPSARNNETIAQGACAQDRLARRQETKIDASRRGQRGHRVTRSRSRSAGRPFIIQTHYGYPYRRCIRGPIAASHDRLPRILVSAVHALSADEHCRRVAISMITGAQIRAERSRCLVFGLYRLNMVCVVLLPTPVSAGAACCRPSAIIYYPEYVTGPTLSARRVSTEQRDRHLRHGRLRIQQFELALQRQDDLSRPADVILCRAGCGRDEVTKEIQPARAHEPLLP